MFRGIPRCLNLEDICQNLWPIPHNIPLWTLVRSQTTELSSYTLPEITQLIYEYIGNHTVLSFYAQCLEETKCYWSPDAIRRSHEEVEDTQMTKIQRISSHATNLLRFYAGGYIDRINAWLYCRGQLDDPINHYGLIEEKEMLPASFIANPTYLQCLVNMKLSEQYWGRDNITDEKLQYI